MSALLSARRVSAGNSHPIPLGTRRMAELRFHALVMMLTLAGLLIGICLSTLVYLMVRS